MKTSPEYNHSRVLKFNRGLLHASRTITDFCSVLLRLPLCQLFERKCDQFTLLKGSNVVGGQEEHCHKGCLPVYGFVLLPCLLSFGACVTLSYIASSQPNTSVKTAASFSYFKVLQLMF